MGRKDDAEVAEREAHADVRNCHRVHRGAARNYVVERMNHLFEVNEKFYDPLVDEILNWMKEQIAASPYSPATRSKQAHANSCKNCI